MKILHTSDWHLGQQFFNYDRGEEHRDMLRQIAAVVREEQPDAMLISGDIFHTGNPSTAAVEMYNNALLDMHEACPTMQIIVTAGNHDSASRLMVDRALWRHFRVTVVGHVGTKTETKTEARGMMRMPDYAAHVIPVCQHDETVGYIAAIPHCYESNYPIGEVNAQRQERVKTYYQGLAEYVRQVSGELPTVLMAHLAVSGCDMSGHDNFVGGMENCDVKLLGNGWDYVALGHIHTPQNITPRVRYSGSPVPVNFGERFEHSVSIVTVEKGQLPEVKTRELKNLIPLVDFPTPLPDANAEEESLAPDDRPVSFSEAVERLRQLDSTERCYIRLIIKEDESLTPLAETQIAEACQGKKWRFCLMKTYRYKRERERIEQQRHIQLDTAQLKEKTPLEIAELFFKMKGIELTDAKRQMITETTETVCSAEL